MDGKTILLVEDDAFLSSLLKTRFQKENFTVIHAVDGEEALNFLREQKPDLVLLDIILPKRSGFEVLEAIRSDPQLNQSPVIIISNLGQESDIQTAKDFGAIEYFVKARTSIDDLIDRVRSYLQ